jgi:hypothetical protein
VVKFDFFKFGVKRNFNIISFNVHPSFMCAVCIQLVTSSVVLRSNQDPFLSELSYIHRLLPNFDLCLCLFQVYPELFGFSLSPQCIPSYPFISGFLHFIQWLPCSLISLSSTICSNCNFLIMFSFISNSFISQ